MFTVDYGVLCSNNYDLIQLTYLIKIYLFTLFSFGQP